MNAVALARISSEKQDRELSLPAQTSRLLEYANRRKLNLIKTFTLIESSTTGDRKQFLECIRFCVRQPEPTALLIDTIDRAQRSFMEIPLLEKYRKSGKLEIHFLRENMVISKDSSGTEILMWHQGVLMAEAYSLHFKENIRRSVQAKIVKGEFPGLAPIGYLNIREVGDRGEIIIDTARAPLIKKLFQKYAAGGVSIKELTKLAADWGLTNKTRGAPKLCKRHIHKLIQNPFYYGLAQWGGNTFEHRYPHLIEKPLFDKCNQILHGRAKSAGKWGTRDFLYRGLIRDHYTQRIISTERKKNKYNYLMSWTADERQQAINEDVVSGQIYKILKSIQIPQDAVAEIIDSLKNTKATELEYHQRAVGDFQRELNQTEKRISSLLTLLLDGKIEHELWQEKDRELKNTALELRNKISMHQQADDGVNDTIVSVFLAVANGADNFAKLAGIISQTGQSGASRARNAQTEISADSDEEIDEENKKSSEVACLRDMLTAIFRTLELKDGTLRYSLKFPFSEFQNIQSKEQWWS